MTCSRCRKAAFSLHNDHFQYQIDCVHYTNTRFTPIGAKITQWEVLRWRMFVYLKSYVNEQWCTYVTYIFLFLRANITKMWHLRKHNLLLTSVCIDGQMSTSNTHHLIGKLITRAVCLCLLYILGKGLKDWTRMIQSLDRADELVPINDNLLSI